MHQKTEIIFIIDDDESVRSSLSLFLRTKDYRVETYGSAEEYLSRDVYTGAGCIILDVNMGGQSGLELQDLLISSSSGQPIIFITGYGNVHMGVKTVKKGAVNYLEKPFKEEELLLSVAEALTLSHKILVERDEIVKAQLLLQKLTPRELEILGYIMTGMLNKQIAHKLDIGEHTVKIHRMSVCEKFGVKSVPEIIRIADKAGIVASGNTD